MQENAAIRNSDAAAVAAAFCLANVLQRRGPHRNEAGAVYKASSCEPDFHTGAVKRAGRARACARLAVAVDVLCPPVVALGRAARLALGRVIQPLFNRSLLREPYVYRARR